MAKRKKRKAETPRQTGEVSLDLKELHTAVPPLDLTAPPLIHTTLEVPEIFWGTALALTPLVFCAVYYLGSQAAWLLASCCGAALLAEWAITVLAQKRITLSDGHAFLMGLLTALSLPATTSIPVAALGAVLAVALGKMAWGGLGQEVFNPVLLGRFLIQVTFPKEVDGWFLAPQPEALSGATLLTSFKYGQQNNQFLELLWGNTNGCLAESCTTVVIVCALLVSLAGYSKWRIPLSAALTLLLGSALLWALDTEMYLDPVSQLLAGGFLFSVAFLATDSTTSPLSARGMWFFGSGIALLTILLRIFSPQPEGVMYAILLLNLAYALLRVTVRREAQS